MKITKNNKIIDIFSVPIKEEKFEDNEARQAKIRRIKLLKQQLAEAERELSTEAPPVKEELSEDNAFYGMVRTFAAESKDNPVCID